MRSALCLNSRWLLAIVVLLYGIGMLMVFDTSAAEIIEGDFARDWHLPFFKQMLMGLLALGAGVSCFYYGLSRLSQNIPWIMGCTCILLCLVFIPHAVKGAHRWINIAGFPLQPSEFARLLFPVWLIWLLRAELHPLFKSVLALAPLVLILIEPDNGTALLLFASLLTALFLAGVPFRYWLLPIIAAGLIGGVCMSRMDHVKQRISVFLDPKSDLQGKGHQPYQAKIAVGSGGLLGRGFGESLQKFRYLPEAKSDYIAAIIAEEYGFVGLVGMVTLYMMLLVFGMRLSIESCTGDLSIIVALQILLLGMAAFINLGVGLGMLPSKGMNLPFVSQGGSSLIASSMMIGFILSAGRRKI